MPCVAFVKAGDPFNLVEKRSGQNEQYERWGENCDGRNDGPQKAMRQVSHKRSGDDDGSGRHLAEGYAVHECPRVHPAPHVNDFLQHERQGREAAAKGKKVHFQHEEGQAEQPRTDEVEEKKAKGRKCQAPDNRDGGKAFLIFLCRLRLRFLP